MSIRFPGRHLGSSVSALVDGQLAPDSAERAWRHVRECPSCRRLVEAEQWLKSQLAGLSGGELPARLFSSLCDLNPWPAAHGVGSGAGGGRSGLVLAGVSVAALGLAVLGATVLAGGGPGGSPTGVTRPAAARSGSGGVTSGPSAAASDVPVVVVRRRELRSRQ